MPAVAYQEAAERVLARKNVARGSHLPKASTEGHRRAARFLSIMGGFKMIFLSKGTNGVWSDPIGSYKIGNC